MDQQVHVFKQGGRHRAASRPSNLLSTLARPAALVASFFLVGTLVVAGSRAAFSDTTENPGNAFAAGTVGIGDDRSGSAMFTVDEMKPGQSESRCIEVTYQGSLAPAEVRLYGGVTGNLASYLNMTVEMDADGATTDCTGLTGTGLYSDTLAGFSTKADWSTGVAAWSPSSAPQSRVFRFTVTLPGSADNGAQGQSATAEFTWEAQNS